MQHNSITNRKLKISLAADTLGSTNRTTYSENGLFLGIFHNEEWLKRTAPVITCNKYGKNSYY